MLFKSMFDRLISFCVNNNIFEIIFFERNLNKKNNLIKKFIKKKLQKILKLN